MHVDSHVDRHCRSPFRTRMSPGASLYRAEQEMGSGLRPGPHRVRQPAQWKSAGHDAKARLTLEPLRTLRPEAKGQAGACPDRTRAIPCKVLGGHDGSIHDPEYARNDLGRPRDEQWSPSR